MLRTFVVIVALSLLASCSNAPTTSTTASPAIVKELAPSGKLRAAINFGNPVLAVKDAASGEARGVSVDLARELARRLDVPVELVFYDAAGKVAQAVKVGAWDIAFLAIDPDRAVDITFSPPYVVIEGAYVVTQASPLKDNAEVDRDGVRVVVGRGSAYDLFLSRGLKHATIVRAATSDAVTDTLLAQKLDVGAGVKQQLEADAKRVSGVRLLPGRFMVINQAMAIPRGREAGARYVREFVEEMKASGFVARSLARNHVEGALVAPGGDAN
jgi:polar amino acid transport system substrate-binding protein